MSYKNMFRIEGYSYIGYENHTSQMHSSDGINIILAEDNPFCVQIDRAEGERVLRLSDGDVCIVFPKTKYHFYTLPGVITRVITMEFGINPAHTDIDSEPLRKLLSSGREYLVFSGGSDIKELMILLQSYHKSDFRTDKQQNASTSLLADAFMLKLAETVFRPEGALLCSHTRKAISYIGKHYKEPITLKTLCEEVGIGERRIQKLFREELSTTFSEFLASFRINKACELLRGSSASIDAIAEAVGYASRQNFTLIFKKKLGRSPQQFRTDIKKRNYRYTHEDLSSMQNIFASFEGAIVG